MGFGVAKVLSSHFIISHGKINALLSEQTHKGFHTIRIYFSIFASSSFYSPPTTMDDIHSHYTANTIAIYILVSLYLHVPLMIFGVVSNSIYVLGVTCDVYRSKGM